jgi:prepilin-type N-terminal cleavage/methylation domain-containing protein
MAIINTLRANNRSYSSRAGFSILEVLITAAIIGIITAIVTIRYGAFNNLILLKNQAFEVALDLRETQTRSLSAIGNSAEFRRPYGIYFSTDEADQYILFADINSNGQYDADETLDTRRFDARFRLRRLCSGSSSSCVSVGDLAVTFRRPNFDAIMVGDGALVTNGVVEIETITGSATRAVNINAAGQITVE